MNLHKCYLTENNCYKTNRVIVPEGIMVHSTGANNPNLRRYVQPDDGLLGANNNGNHWNQAAPGGSSVCVHAFIGKLKDGSIGTYQTLPWNHRGWHCGKGSKGSANNTHISFEICEDGLNDAAYFAAVYQEAVEFCVFLCKKYGMDETKIICHSEGAKLGIASNHADVMHWFPKFGKSMDTFRAAVKAKLSGAALAAEKNAVAGGEHAALSSALDKLEKLGVVSAADYWKAHAGGLPYLDDLIIKAAAKITRAGNAVPSVSAALTELVEAGVIAAPDYWAKNYGKVPYLDQLIMKLAGAV